MSNQPTATVVTASIEVDAVIDEAFKVFTQDMASWWPAEHHILQAPLKEMVFDARVGGDIYDVGTDGSECRWGRVLAYDPPSRIVFGWKVSPQWGIEEDPDRTSEVEVRFSEITASRTRVEVEHRHIERHGDGWEGMHQAVASEGGWPLTLHNFATRIAGTA